MKEKNIALNIESLIVSTKHKRRKCPEEANIYGQQLLADSTPFFEKLKTNLGAEDLLVREIAYELSNELLQCGIDYFITIQNEIADLSHDAVLLIKEAKNITHNADILERIEDNLDGINDWKKSKPLRDELNRMYEFHKIQLKTAFTFMTCDGEIDKNEVALIKKMNEETAIFGNIDIDKELDFLIETINLKGKGFLKDYLKVIKSANLTEEKELQLIDTAIKTLNADGKVDYFEVKFFRVFRTLLKAKDQAIIDRFPDLPEQFLEVDIFNNVYLDLFFDNYFGKMDLPTFDKLDPKEEIEYVDPDDYQGG